MIARCQYRSLVALAAFLLIAPLPTQSYFAGREFGPTSFLSRGSETHRAEQVPSTRVTFNEPVIPPAPPASTALESVDGAVEDEIQNAKSPPAMMVHIVLLWKFVIYLCVSLAVAVVALVLHNQFSHHVMLEQQAAKLQFLLVFAVLIACPACRAIVASNYGRAFWVLAIRNILEMWLILLAFCAIPHMVLDYLNRCCLMGQQQAACIQNADFDHVNFKLGAQVRADTGLPHCSGEADRSGGVLIPSSDWDVRSDMDIVKRLFKPLAFILAIRPVIQIGRSIAHLLFGVSESWEISAICTSISFTLLTAAIVHGVRKLTPITRSMADALGVQPIMRQLQVILAAILLAAQAQDLLFIVYHGSENQAQVFAGTLFVIEIVAGLIIVGALLTSDSLVEMVRFRVPHTEVTVRAWLMLLVKPYAVTSGAAIDGAVPLKKRPLADPVTPVYVQENSEHQRRNIWHAVLTDIFAGKVRSKSLAVVSLSSILMQAIFAYPNVVDAGEAIGKTIMGDSAMYVSPGIVFVLSLFYVWLCWLTTGIELLGNNIYWSKWWLLLTMLVNASFSAFSLAHFFTYGTVLLSVSQLAYTWMALFQAALGVFAVFECLRLLLAPEHVGDFYRNEADAQQYTSIMLEKTPPEQGHRHTRYAKKLKRISSNTPSLLLVGAIATVPVALSFALVMMFCGLDVIRYARIGQVYFQAFQTAPNAEKALEDFMVLDRNYDKLVSADEAGLTTILGLLGSDAEKFVVPMNTLWASVGAQGEGALGVTTFVAAQTSIGGRMGKGGGGPSGDRKGDSDAWGSFELGGEDRKRATGPTGVRDEKKVVADAEAVVAKGSSRSLGQDELHSFLKIMHRTWAVFKSLIKGDIAVASQSLLEALDRNKDGTLDQREFPLSEIALALQAVAPHFAHLVAPMLGDAWNAADVDQDGLSLQELPSFLLEIKKRIMHLQQAVQDLVLSLVLSGVSGADKSEWQLIDDVIAAPSPGQPAPAPSLAPAPSSMSSSHDEYDSSGDDEDEDAQDVSMLQESHHRHHEVSASRQWRHHHEGASQIVRRTPRTVHLLNRRHREVATGPVDDRPSEVDEVASGPVPAPAKAPNYALPKPSGLSSAPAPARASARQVAADPISLIMKTLMSNTASLGEAFSLLLVAVDAILPERTGIAETLLTKVDGRRLSTQLEEVAEQRLRDHSISGWTSEGVQKMMIGLTQFMESAMPWLMAEGARAKVLLVAVAQGAGSSDDADADKALDNAFAVLNTNKTDSKLDSTELGLRGALALVNPALASHAPELLSFLAGKGDIDKATFGLVLVLLTRTLGAFVSDVNGDGEANALDVKFLAQTAADKLGDLKGPSQSLLQTWKPAVLRKVVHSETDLMQGSSQAQPKIAIGTTGALGSYAGQAASSVQWGVQLFVTLEIWRIELALYTSALLAFAFAVFVVAMPFVGYTKLYEQMQEGGTYLGSSSIESIKGRLDYATAYPGTLFSTVIFGAAIVFGVLMIVLTTLAVPSVYMPLLYGLKVSLFWMVFVLLCNLFLKRVVLDRICMKDGEVTHPRLFACVYVMLIITNFAVGALNALSRLAFMIPFAFVKFHILSTSLLGNSQVGYDGGYSSFLAVVKHQHDVSNPIRVSFLQAIAPQGHRLFGEKPLLKPNPQTSKQLTRNRLWLGYMMSKNTELQAQRSGALNCDTSKSASYCNCDDCLGVDKHTQRQKAMAKVASNQKTV